MFILIILEENEWGGGEHQRAEQDAFCQCFYVNHLFLFIYYCYKNIVMYMILNLIKANL